MAIIRIYTGPDGKSHFEDVEPRFEPLDDKSERAELGQEGAGARPGPTDTSSAT